MSTIIYKETDFMDSPIVVDIYRDWLLTTYHHFI